VNPIVFNNATKGDPADKKDIAAAFPDMSEEDIWKSIFEKGELAQTQEDRVDHVAEEKLNVAKLAQAVATHSHVLPVSALQKFHETKSDKELANLRMPLYSAADIERELKNAKFKPLATSVTSQDTVIDAIAAIRAADTVPIVRDQHLCVIRLVNAASVTAAQVMQAFGEVVRPMHGKILRHSAEDVVAVIDLQDAVKTLQQNPVLKQCQVHVSEEFYIPRDPGFSDDLTPVTSGMDAKAQAGGAPPAAGKGGGKGKGGVGAQPPGAAATSSSTLEAQLADLKADDRPESAKPGKGGKKGKQPQQQQQTDDDQPRGALKKPQVDEEEEDDEPVATMKPKKKK
jgi:ribosome maturation protein Sdo1